MALEHSGYIDLPPHSKSGGFDHAAVHLKTSSLYVAHTANDALDVIDCALDCYSHSIPNLTGVAGALVAEEEGMIFTSNRGENTVGIFSADNEAGLVKIPVGIRPNGLAYNSRRGVLLAANVGDPALPGSYTLSLVDVPKRSMIASIPVPGRTRWTIYNPQTDAFYVNISDPAQIVMIEGSDLSQVSRTFAVPAAGPHGLDRDGIKDRLFCACDGKRLIVLDIRSGEILDERDLGGIPDVIFFNAALQHLYVAIGDPGIIEVFDTHTMQRIQTVPTEAGAHTIAFDAGRNKVYAFLPQTHRASVYVDRPV